MNNIALEYYKTRLQDLNQELKGVKNITSRLYLVRLIVFMLFVIMFALSFSDENRVLYIAATVLLFITFVAIAIFDQRMGEKKRNLENRIKFNEEEIKSLNHKFDLREDGDQYSKLNPHLSRDFDLFGVGSLYQYINRSVTIRGRARFAASLVACELSHKVISSRAEAIKELSTKVGFIEGFTTVGNDVNESGAEIDNLLKWLKVESSKELFIDITRFVMPLVSLVVLALSILGYMPYTLLLMMFCGSLIVLHSNNKKLNSAHALLGRSTKIFEKYSTLIKMVESEEFCSTLLKEEREKLIANKESASRSIKALKEILNRFDYRCNVYVSVVLNGLLLFDFHTYVALLRWKREHKDIVEQWFDAITEIDSLIGFGVYAYNCNDKASYAKIVDDDFQIKAQDMGHPLILSEASVSNSIEIVGRPAVVIITGANMAGKSTFLRTLAVNLILGMNGAPIRATHFTFTPIKILSSIKIQDSLMNRESYFYAELLRLSNILEGTKEQPQSIIILDEILRGTNTKDKQQGSIGLLRKIIAQRGVAIIATHDLIIGKMEDEYPNCVSNYCFEVEIDGDLLSFDYKLKNGISSKLNASFLMRRMGIID